MHVEERNAEILRLARMLVSVIGAELKTGDCAACKLPVKPRIAGAYTLPDAEARRTLGRARMYVEAAANSADRALEQVELLSDMHGV